MWKVWGFITHDPDPSKTQMKLIFLSSPSLGCVCVCLCVCVCVVGVWCVWCVCVWGGCVCSKKPEGSFHPVLSALAKQCLQGSSWAPGFIYGLHWTLSSWTAGLKPGSCGRCVFGCSVGWYCQTAVLAPGAASCRFLVLLNSLLPCTPQMWLVVFVTSHPLPEIMTS